MQNEAYPTRLNTTLSQFNEHDFRQWFGRVVRAGVDYETVLFEALDHMEDQAASGGDPVYELRGQYTRTGNPEIFTL